jgi:hypothetical protein
MLRTYSILKRFLLSFNRCKSFFLPSFISVIVVYGNNQVQNDVPAARAGRDIKELKLFLILWVSVQRPPGTNR